MSISPYSFYTSPPVWYWILVIAVAAFTIACRWIVYRKAHEHGWAAIIPFYSDYVLCRVARKQKLFIPLLIMEIGSMVVAFIMVGWLFMHLAVAISGMDIYSYEPYAGSYDPILSVVTGSFIFLIIILAIAIVALILEIMILHGVSVSFGHGAGFTVGLIFLPIIFWAILAFGKNRFLPPPLEAEGGPAGGPGSGGQPFTNITCGQCGTRFFYDESRVAPGESFICTCPACGLRMQFTKR